MAPETTFFSWRKVRKRALTFEVPSTLLPILRLTFLESSCDFRKFGIKENGGYLFLLDRSSGPMLQEEQTKRSWRCKIACTFCEKHEENGTRSFEFGVACRRKCGWAKNTKRSHVDVELLTWWKTRGKGRASIIWGAIDGGKSSMMREPNSVWSSQFLKGGDEKQNKFSEHKIGRSFRKGMSLNKKDVRNHSECVFLRTCEQL